MMVISELHSSPLAAPVSRRICNKLTTALTYPELEVSITCDITIICQWIIIINLITLLHLNVAKL